MLRVVTVPVIAHDRVVDWPGAMLAGFAVKEVMTGGSGVTVAVTVLVAEPPLLLAVSV